MRLADVLVRLKNIKAAAFGTADVMAYLDVEKSHASKLLARLVESGHLVHLKRGLWAFSEGLDPLVLPGYLTAPFPSYVSLQSALYYHGMIAQIPAVTYVVSLARTRTYETDPGHFSIHHVNATFFFGCESVRGSEVKMAVPEKALLDFLYLSPARSKLFRALPELALPRRFSVRRAGNMIRRVRSAARRRLLEKSFESAIEKADRTLLRVGRSTKVLGKGTVE